MEKHNPMKIDAELLKSLFFENWTSLVILILGFFLFKSCQGNAELQIANRNLKLEVKHYVASADNYINRANKLNDKITLLEAQKQKVKTQVVYIQKQTGTAIKKVYTLNTKQIATYYQDRYKLPVTITQYGVALSDTLSKKNIVELVEKDGCLQEVKLFKTQLQLEEKKGIVKDTIIGNIAKANANLNQAVEAQGKIIGNVEKSLRQERNKKTFWQVTSGAILAGAVYLLIVR